MYGEYTSHVFSFRMVFFYVVTTGRIFDISSCFMLSLEYCRRSSHLFLSSRPRTTRLVIVYVYGELLGTVVWLSPDRFIDVKEHIHSNKYH